MNHNIKNRSIVIFGFGSQGKAHALNLMDSGMQVTICLPESSLSIMDVKSSGFKLISDPVKAAKKADIAAIMVPDAVQKALYDEIKEALPVNSTLVFAHGLNIHYELFKPRDDLDVILVAPMAQGDAVRKMFLDKLGVPTLIAVKQNITGSAWQTAKAYARGIGATDDRILETTFAEETETDLFSEQTLTVGGLWGLITAAFDTLVEDGYSPEIAYYCCLKEVKILSDMFARLGILGTFERISDTARFGALSKGPQIIGNEVREQMKKVLQEIKNGDFITELKEDFQRGKETKTKGIMKRISEHKLEHMHKQFASRNKIVP